MSETSREIKSLLESLLKRVEVGQLATDKHVEAQLAFNKQVSSDLSHLRKEVDLMQLDVDEVRQHHDQSKPTAPPSPCLQPQASTTPSPEQSFMHLANVGPPLIGMRPTTSLFGMAQPRTQHEAYHEEQWDTYMIKLPSTTFPSLTVEHLTCGLIGASPTSSCTA
ncbi:hypothetical protein D1007_09538 [Hordeum vulgare]|nr:hypothetical protein D1007_09538 [Hordeum vulgare]